MTRYSRKNSKDSKLVALGERLEKIKEKHEQGLLDSKEFLKQLLELARDVLEAEKHVDPIEEQDKSKAALTELFQQVKNADTAVIVERIVADIDDIVQVVRFYRLRADSSRFWLIFPPFLQGERCSENAKLNLEYPCSNKERLPGKHIARLKARARPPGSFVHLLMPFVTAVTKCVNQGLLLSLRICVRVGNRDQIHTVA
jgi:hypothetical protein